MLYCVEITGKYLHGKKIMETHENGRQVLLIYGALNITTILMPFLAVGMIFILRSSPIVLSHRLLGHNTGIPHPISSFLHWILFLADWATVTTGGLSTLAAIAYNMELLMTISLILKNLSHLDPSRSSWKDRLRVHQELELVLNFFNILSGKWMPLAYFFAVSVGVMSMTPTKLPSKLIPS